MVDLIVEANSFEHNALWDNNHKKLDWKSATNGHLETIDSDYDKPICISILIDTIEDKKVLFWFGTSELVDYKLIDEWLDETYPDINKTDAINFHQVIGQL